MKHTSLAILAVLALGAAPALAQAPTAAPSPTRDMFDVLDTNKDGILTRAEYNVQSDTMFKRMDKDGDGKISAAERDAQRAEWKAMRERASNARPAGVPASAAPVAR